MAVALGLYLRSTHFGLVYLDDDLLIVDEQSQLATPSSAWRAFARPYFAKSSRDHAYYRPLATASYVLDAQLSGANASSFHRTNCLLHAATAGLLFFWLRSLGCGKNTALFGGLVFATHPALCEAVAWIPARPDLLMTLFVLVAWLCLQKAHDHRAWPSRTCHLLAWLLALLSKEAAIVLPLVWWLSGRLISGRPLRRSAAPWMVWGWGGMGLLYILVRSIALSGGLGTSGVTLTGILSNTGVLLSSLGKLLIPINLSVLAIPEDTWVWPGLVVLGALAAAYRARWLGSARALFATIAYVLFMLPSLPASTHLILENRLYLPAAILIWLVCGIAEDVGLRGSFKSVAGVAAIMSLVWRTNAYLEAFRERRSFAEAAVQGSPHSAYARKILGVTLHLAGDTAGAFRAYQDAIGLDSSEPVAHNNLGVIFMARGDLVQAERQLRKELEINPGYAEAQQNLAMVLHAQGRSK